MAPRYTRRRLLTLTGSGLVSGIGGCLGAPENGTPENSSTAEDAGARVAGGNQSADHRVATPTDGGPLAQQGWPSTICEQDQRELGLRPIHDPEPVPADEWPGIAVGNEDELVETGKPDESVVIGVEREGTARAYPLATLWFAEIVNDTLAGPLLVTYCPLCRSGLVAERQVQGTTTRFGVSGLLWQPPERLYPEVSQSGEGVLGGGPQDATAEAFRDDRRNLVLVDRETESYWSQLLGRAICGPARSEQLPLLPATITTFGDWRRRYPSTTVVLPPRTERIPEE